MDSRDDEDNALPDNVSPIRDRMMFVFPPIPVEPSVESEDAVGVDPPGSAEGAAGAPYYIEVGSMIEGELTITWKIVGIETKDDGVESLKQIGMIWANNSGCIGRLRDKDGTEIAVLEVHHGYAVLPVVSEEGG